MKKVSIWFLFLSLLCMFYISMGQFMTLSLGISEAQREAQTEILNCSNIVFITFSSTDIDSGKVCLLNNKEVRYHNKLYDIVSVTKRGNIFTLRVYHDEKEEGIISEIEETIHSWLGDPVRDLSKHLVFKFQSLQDILLIIQTLHVFSQGYKAFSLVVSQTPILHQVIEVVISPPRLTHPAL